MGIHILKVCIIAASVVAFVFFVACTGGNQWVNEPDSTLNVKGIPSKFLTEPGLWKVGSAVRSTTACVTVQDTLKSWFDGVRALSVIACLLSAATVLLSVLPILKGVLKLAIVSSYAGSLFMAIGLIVFAANKPSNYSYTYGWSFTLGWIGVVFSGFAGTLVIIFMKPKRNQDVSSP